VINFFASDQPKHSKEMEEFEFELLKTELLTQPIEKDGSQLFHRKSSTGSWIKKVSVQGVIVSTFVFLQVHRVQNNRILEVVYKVVRRVVVID
jgi:hypothetical protein